MINAIVSDLGAVLLFARDKSHKGKLSPLHEKLSKSSNYKFWDHFRLNKKLLKYFNSLRGKYGLYMFTAGTIHNASELRKILDGVFQNIYSNVDVPFSKKDPKSFELIAKKLNLNSSEILYVDDNCDIVSCAKSVGLLTVCHKDNTKTISKIKKILSG